uniref:Uncharacterized protein n=1 Tax=Clytia hemisphaerica TaxID=252671 RepID=A0A7M5WWA3_9CNID
MELKIILFSYAVLLSLAILVKGQAGNYYLSTTLQSWQDAEDDCKARGGHLASICEVVTTKPTTLTKITTTTANKTTTTTAPTSTTTTPTTTTTTPTTTTTIPTTTTTTPTTTTTTPTT